MKKEKSVGGGRDPSQARDSDRSRTSILTLDA